MKILFALHPEKGHVNPMIGTAQALTDLGHHVSVVATGDIESQIKAAGLEFHRDLVGASDHAPQGRALVEFMKIRQNMIDFLEVGFVQMAEQQVGAYKDFFLRTQPDLLIIDPMNYAAILAAELQKRPWVGISSSLTSVLPDGLESEILKLVALLGPKRAQLFEKFEVAARFRAVDCLSPQLNISFSTEAFVGASIDDVELVGPALPIRSRGDTSEPFREISQQGRPVVYASFGSQLYHQPELFKKILAAGEHAKVFLVLAIGDLADLREWTIEPENCQYYRYAPQVEILKKANLFITHGGANSMTESLVARVPVLISPMCNDQEHQAYFAERAGVGRMINLEKISVAELSEAITRALQDEEMRANMERVSATYQQNGSLKAAHWIDQLGKRLEATPLKWLSFESELDFAARPDLRLASPM